MAYFNKTYYNLGIIYLKDNMNELSNREKLLAEIEKEPFFFRDKHFELSSSPKNESFLLKVKMFIPTDKKLKIFEYVKKNAKVKNEHNSSLSLDICPDIDFDVLEYNSSEITLMASSWINSKDYFVQKNQLEALFNTWNEFERLLKQAINS